MLKEFKKFALRGNMLDLAIGVIIGSIFSNLVNSIVNDLLMPIIGLLTGGIDFSNLFIQLAGEQQQTLAAARDAGATIAYGNFVTLFINFLIVAWVLFLTAKGINILRHTQEQKKVNPRSEDILAEIRDLLRMQQSNNKNEDHPLTDNIDTCPCKKQGMMI